MSRIRDTKRAETFAALKLIELLYKEAQIPDHVFRNILRQYADKEEMASFQCFHEQKKEAQKCTDCTD